MKTKIQIKSIFDKVLFEYESENNSQKITLLEAIKSGADLYKADLSGADLSGADLSGADLSGADLYKADLSRAYLSGADLSRAYLFGADLYETNLSGAYLYETNLSGADLSGADLSDAYLSGADLSGADLYKADLSRAYLSGANLYEAQGLNTESVAFQQTRILPEGDIIGYKKCYTKKGNASVVKILIPKEAKRLHAFGRKCRAEYAKVLEILGGQKKVYSDHERDFEYVVGETVKPTQPFCEDYRYECSSGIHFFITKAEAEAW